MAHFRSPFPVMSVSIYSVLRMSLMSIDLPTLGATGYLASLPPWITAIVLGVSHRYSPKKAFSAALPKQ